MVEERRGMKPLASVDPFYFSSATTNGPAGRTDLACSWVVPIGPLLRPIPCLFSFYRCSVISLPQMSVDNWLPSAQVSSEHISWAPEAPRASLATLRPSVLALISQLAVVTSLSWDRQLRADNGFTLTTPASLEPSTAR